MIDTLRSIAGSDRPWARERAEIALSIVEQAQRGEISTEEYTELMLDLARLDSVELAAEDIELKTALVTAITLVAKVA
jgi:rRNA-processing protein FCF1